MVINLFKKETGGNKKKLVDPNITQENLTDTGIPKLLKEKSDENVEMTKAQFVLPNNANQNFKKNNNEKEKIEARIIEESLVKPTNKLVRKIEDDKGVQQDTQNITKEVSNKEGVRKNINISKKGTGETNIPQKEKIEARIIEESLVKPTNKLVRKIEDDKGVQQDTQNITKEVSNKEGVRKNINISKKGTGETNIPQKEKIEARIIEESLVKPTNKLVQKIEDDKGVQQDIQNITKEVSNKEVMRKNINISKKEIEETNIPQKEKSDENVEMTKAQFVLPNNANQNFKKNNNEKEKTEAHIIEESLVKPTNKLVRKIEDDKGVQQDIQNITKEVSNKEGVRKNINISKEEIGKTNMPQKEKTEARIIEETLVKPTNRIIQKTKNVKKVKNDEEIQQNIQKIVKQKDNQGELKKNIAMPKKENVKINTEQEKKEDQTTNNTENPIPILKTYYYDVKKMTETNSGSQLRTILAKELDEKMRAKQEYKKKTREILKESAILKQKYSTLKQQEKAHKKLEDKIHEKEISDVIANAVNYMQHGKIATPANINIKNESSEEEAPVNPTNITKGGLLSIFKPKKFSYEQKQMFKEKEKIIQKKEAFKEAWQKFEEKKNKSKEEGAEIRNVRDFEKPNNNVQNNILIKQNIVAIFIIIILFVGFSSILFVIIKKKVETPNVVPIPQSVLYEAVDVIQPENTIFVDITTTFEAWGDKLSEEKSTRFIKFVPYIVSDSNIQKQATLDEFFRGRGSNISNNFFTPFDSYYFIGTYSDKTLTNYVLIVSIDKYTDAVTTLFNFNNQLLPLFAQLFPNIFNSNISKQKIETRTTLIDNKSVKTLTSLENRSHQLSYYFFNRNYVVFVLGSPNSISLINENIRSANK